MGPSLVLQNTDVKQKLTLLLLRLPLQSCGSTEQSPHHAQMHGILEMDLQNDHRNKQYVGKPFHSGKKWLFSILFGTLLSC